MDDLDSQRSTSLSSKCWGRGCVLLGQAGLHRENLEKSYTCKKSYFIHLLNNCPGLFLNMLGTQQSMKQNSCPHEPHNLLEEDAHPRKWGPAGTNGYYSWRRGGKKEGFLLYNLLALNSHMYVVWDSQVLGLQVCGLWKLSLFWRRKQSRGACPTGRTGSTPKPIKTPLCQLLASNKEKTNGIEWGA